MHYTIFLVVIIFHVFPFLIQGFIFLKGKWNNESSIEIIKGTLYRAREGRFIVIVVNVSLYQLTLSLYL